MLLQRGRAQALAKMRTAEAHHSPLPRKAPKAIIAAMPTEPANPIRIFDPASLRRHRERAAQRSGHDFLFEEASDRLVECLEDVTRRFPLALDLGARDGLAARLIGARGGVERLVQLDPAPGFLARCKGERVAGEAEALPFAPASFDLVLSALLLHWTNDLPGALLQLRQVLKPDGLLLASLFGGETLWELRQALLEAEAETEGGASPRVSPFADIRDLGSLLQRAGFALPVLDSDTITVTYPDALALMRDLRGMGETNTLFDRRRGFSRPATLARAAARYHELFAQPDGRIPATFQIITLTAWSPHQDQPKPLRPGSAETSLATVFGQKP